MGDARHTLLPPSDGAFTPATPSGLTPNTRSEAEAALSHNSSAQTDSAAPSDGMYPFMGAGGGNTREGEADDGVTEAQKAYRRPGGPVRTSSANYEAALRLSHHQASVSSNMSTDTATGDNITAGGPVASPTSMTTPFPPPGKGVVPLHTGIGTGQSEALKRAKPRGLSLGELGRQPSWNEQDLKHILSAGLMAEVKGDAGYASGAEGKR